MAEGGHAGLTRAHLRVEGVGGREGQEGEGGGAEAQRIRLGQGCIKFPLSPSLLQAGALHLPHQLSARLGQAVGRRTRPRRLCFRLSSNLPAVTDSLSMDTFDEPCCLLRSRDVQIRAHGTQAARCGMFDLASRSLQPLRHACWDVDPEGATPP